MRAFLTPSPLAGEGGVRGIADTPLLDPEDPDGVGAPGGGHDLHVGARPAPHQRLPDRRFEAHATVGRVGLGGTDDGVRLLGSALFLDGDLVQEAHLAAGGSRLDHHVVLDDRLQLADPRLQEGLLVAGGVVLEILGEVSVLPSRLDLAHDLRPAYRGELFELTPHVFQAVSRDGDLRLSGHPTPPGMSFWTSAYMRRWTRKEIP